MKHYPFKKYASISLSMVLSLTLFPMTKGFAFDTDSSLSSDSYSGPSSPVIPTEEDELAALIGGQRVYEEPLSKFLQEQEAQGNNVLTPDFMSHARHLLQGLSPAYDLPAIKFSLVKMLADVPERYLEDPRFMEEVQKFSKIIGISHSFSLIKNKAMQGASLEEIASFRATVEEFLVRIIKMEGKPLDLLQKSSIASSLASVPPQEYADFIDKFLTLQEWVSGHQKYAIMHRLSALDSGRRCAPDFLETLLQDTRDLAPAERASEILRRLRRLGKDTSV